MTDNRQFKNWHIPDKYKPLAEFLKAFIADDNNIAAIIFHLQPCIDTVEFNDKLVALLEDLR